MRIETVSLIVASFVSGSLGVASLLRNFRSRVCLSFSVLMLILFVHDVMGMLEAFESSEKWLRTDIHALVVLALGPAIIWFEKEVLGPPQKLLSRVLAFYLPSVVIAALFTSFSHFSKVAAQFYYFSHVMILLPVVIFFVRLDRAERESLLKRERLRLRFALWGGLIALSFHITDALHYSNLEQVPALGALARVLYLIFIFQTFIQKEFMTLEEVMNKIALFGGIALVLSVIYSMLVIWVGDQPGMFFFNTFIASFVVMVLFDPIRRLTTRVMRRLFLSKHLLLEEELNRFLQNLMGATSIETKDLALKIYAILKKCLGVEGSALYLLERDGLSYTKVRVGNTDGGPDEISASNPLVEYMTLRRGRPFVSETLDTDRDFFQSGSAQKFCQSCLETMRLIGTDFVIPIVYEAKPIAFVAVRAGERIALTNEEMRLLIPVARQLAHILKNAQTFDYLKDRDKLSAVGEMAAGLAHEIKNPLGAIKGAAELLAENMQNTPNEFLNIILTETDRLSNVLTEFLDYAKPRRLQQEGSCDPLKVVEHCSQLALKATKVHLEILAEEKSYQVESDPEILKQILLNLFLNAVSAMDNTQSPTLKVSVREIKSRRFFSLESLPLFKKWEGWKKPELGITRDHLQIEIRDNGTGIEPDVMKRLFVPFYTTKPKGSGLGLAICKRLIESLGGTIQVKSVLGEGSAFVLRLPMKRSQVDGQGNPSSGNLVDSIFLSGRNLERS